MSADYAEVLRDLEAREAKLREDLAEIMSAKLALQALLRIQQAEAALSVPRGKYAGVGLSKAIRDVLAGGDLLTRDEIYERLRAGGWTTESKNPLANVLASLYQMKETVVERVENRWRKRQTYT